MQCITQLRHLVTSYVVHDMLDDVDIMTQCRQYLALQEELLLQ